MASLVWFLVSKDDAGISWDELKGKVLQSRRGKASSPRSFALPGWCWHSGIPQGQVPLQIQSFLLHIFTIFTFTKEKVQNKWKLKKWNMFHWFPCAGSCRSWASRRRTLLSSSLKMWASSILLIPISQFYLHSIVIRSWHKGVFIYDLGQVRVPGSALLGRENTGFYQLMEQLPQVALLIMIIIFLFLIGTTDDWCPFCGNLWGRLWGY